MDMKMSYKDMVLGKMAHQPDEITLRTIEMTDRLVEKARTAHPEMIEEFLVKLAGNLNSCHFDCNTAWWAICRMKPVVLTEEGVMVNKGFKEYLDCIGLTPETAMNHMHKAYEMARVEGRRLGVEAPVVPPHYTMYDVYVTMAMYYSDYWVMGQTMEHAAKFAYCYLSDPDYPKDKNKIWKYIMG